MSIKNSHSVLFILLVVLELAALSVVQVLAKEPKTLVLHLEEGCTIENLYHELVPPDTPLRGQAVLVVTGSPNGNWTTMCTGRMP